MNTPTPSDPKQEGNSEVVHDGMSAAGSAEQANKE